MASKDDKKAAPAKGGDAKKGGEKSAKKDDGKKGAEAGAKKGGDGAKKGGEAKDGAKKGGDAGAKKDGKETAKKADGGKAAPAPAAAAAAKTTDGKDASKAKAADGEKKAASKAAAKGDDDGGDDEGGKDGKTSRGPFRRFYFRGHEVHKLLDLSHAELMKLMHARVRRRFARGHIPMNLLRKLRAAKKAAPEGEKPKVIKTHFRNMIILPEMVASVVGVYNGLSFTQVEIKPDMIGHYLGEFALSYKPVKHGRPGVGSTGSSRFIPLK
jgi:small subunit ribosomal protein S15e